MPELPEVETVRRGLAPIMEGQEITLAQVNRPDLRWPFPPDMAKRLTGKTVVRLRRRSKYILVDLSSNETLIIHLGMSGRMLISGDPHNPSDTGHPKPAKHDHVVFDMANGGRVTFNDTRRFGAMDLCDTAHTENHWLIRDIGPEPLGNQFDEAYLIKAFQSRSSPVKTALLDQKLVAGLGNIYVCEVLHRAKIDPRRKVNRISATRVAPLVPIIRDVLNEAIAAGGSSLQDHRQTNGELGYFQHAFKAYGRESQPCTTSGCDGTIQRIVQSGRSTFFCPKCQR